jgi:hypothetical protein
MIRRKFLAILSGLPFLGFLKPEPVPDFSSGGAPTTYPDIREALGPDHYHIGPKWRFEEGDMIVDAGPDMQKEILKMMEEEVIRDAT